jgi:hypothetical protein
LPAAVAAPAGEVRRLAVVAVARIPLPLEVSRRTARPAV